MIQVVTYESPALHQARQVTQTLTAAGYPPDKIRFLVNRADATSGMSKSTIEEYFGRKPDFEIQSDGALVLDANNRGQPFVRLSPDAPISKDVARVAHRLATEVMEPRPAPRSQLADAHVTAGAS